MVNISGLHTETVYFHEMATLDLEIGIHELLLEGCPYTEMRYQYNDYHIIVRK